MLSTHAVESAADWGYSSPARSAKSALSDLEEWMAADTRTSSAREPYRSPRRQESAPPASPRRAAASPAQRAAASPVQQARALASTSDFSATIRSYDTSVTMSPSTVRSSSASTGAPIPGRTLAPGRTSSSAADYGFGVGSPASSVVVVAPEVAEMKRIVERRRTRISNIGLEAGGLGSSPRRTGSDSLLSEPMSPSGYVSPYRGSAAANRPASQLLGGSRNGSPYESPASYANPHGLGGSMHVPVELAGTEVSTAVGRYHRTGSAPGSAGRAQPPLHRASNRPPVSFCCPSPPACLLDRNTGRIHAAHKHVRACRAVPGDPALETSADDLLERLKEEQFTRERKGIGRPAGALSVRLDQDIGGTAAMAASGGGGGAPPPRVLTLDEKLEKIRGLVTSSKEAVEGAIEGATRVETDAPVKTAPQPEPEPQPV